MTLKSDKSAALSNLPQNVAGYPPCALKAWIFQSYESFLAGAGVGWVGRRTSVSVNDHRKTMR